MKNTDRDMLISAIAYLEKFESRSERGKREANAFRAIDSLLVAAPKIFGGPGEPDWRRAQEWFQRLREAGYVA